MAKLYDQFGREIDMAKYRKPSERVLSVAPILDSYREYITDGLTPERLATVFKRADAGDVRSQAELFELLEERDGHVLCERDKRRNVIVDLDYSIEPAGDDPRAKAVSDFVEQFFIECSVWDDCLVALQDAVGKGYAALEIEWDTSEGQAMPANFENIKQQRFLFTDENGLLARVPRLLTDDEPMGMEIPPWKTIMHTYGGKSGAANRAGIYRVASWMVLFKNYAIKDWVIFCELFGMPLRLGKYSAGATTEEKEALYSAISSLGSDAAGVISESTKIEFIETTKGSSASDLWQRLADFCNAEISKAILGQTLTAQVGSSGSYAAAKTHNEVRLDLLKADGRALTNTVRDQLIRPLVGFNFGWDTPIPRLNVAYPESGALDRKSEWVTRLMRAGMPMSLQYLRKTFDMPEPDEGDEIIQKTPGNASGDTPVVAKVVAKAKPGQAATLTTLVEQELEGGGMDALLDPVAQLLEEVESLEEFKERLPELFGKLEPVDFGNALQRGLALAELSGRFDVME